METEPENELFLIPVSHVSGRAEFHGSQRLTPRTSAAFYVSDDTDEWVQLWLDPSRIQPHFFPLVLFGPSGTGKTTLAKHLISHHVVELVGAQRNKPILTTAVDFARQVNAHLHTDTLHEFCQTYVNAPAVLIDDGHQLEHYPTAQRVLVTLLDHWREENSLVIFTSLSAPISWRNVSEPLRSRACCGLSLPISRPGATARRWILERLLENERLAVTPAALRLLVDRCVWSYPMLQQWVLAMALKRKSAKGTGGRQPLSVGFVEKWLERPQYDKLDCLSKLCALVAKEFQTSVRSLRGPSRRQSLVVARDVAIHLAKQCLRLSFTEIGKYFGNRDHSTIIHACDKIERILNSDNQPLRTTIDRLQTEWERWMPNWNDEAGVNARTATTSGKTCL